ncbi:uncharacterized protein [Gossypium hirsutum]|uniref:Uncharacterized protein isoform X3 n=1 Tax=Gossypium hirsutum TaxID=3635 RepID=A0ABM3BH69_GOSHI|nr:uncharacterized protein LOC121226793 isoform X3 [Gossypium hirsutum]
MNKFTVFRDLNFVAENLGVEFFKGKLNWKQSFFILSTLMKSIFNQINQASSEREALDLKPNYVRTWANMGISYPNQQTPDTAAPSTPSGVLPPIKGAKSIINIS